MSATTPPQRPVRLLPEEVANQIAAGEVVERPASVLKELLENALDAGAGRVAVEVAGGGRQLIRVVDDGHGMGPDDLILALERHATSKVATAEELLGVTTLGFRGEALPSIASVSKLTLRSRRADDQTGGLVRVEAGVIREHQEVGCPVGTLVEMRDLFFNTPARRKFLKSPATEGAQLAAAFLRLALARPEVAFTYTVAGKTLYDLPPSQDLRPRVAALLGREAAQHMVEMAREEGPLTVWGLAALPSHTRRQADQIHTYVNGRHVRDKVLTHAVIQAYQGLMPGDRRPVVVLHLGLDPAQVDVNVHPAKTEVRFRQANEVHQALTRALRAGLAEAAPPPASAVRHAAPVMEPRSTPVAPPLPRPSYRVAQPGAAPAPLPAGSPPPPPPPRPDPPASGAQRRPSAFSGGAPAAPTQPRPLFSGTGGLAVLGQLHNLYILCAGPQGLVIVDQHAAHERLHHLALKEGLGRGQVPSQGLLAPVVLDLGPDEDAWARELSPELSRLGLELTPFGGRSWAVRSVPVFWSGGDCGVWARDVLAELAHSGLKAQTPEFLEAALASLACRSALKRGQRLAPAEMQHLVDQVAALPPPVTCPHGRPVFLELSMSQLARHFKRAAEPA